jgi:hypothetical protein
VETYPQTTESLDEKYPLWISSERPGVARRSPLAKFQFWAGPPLQEGQLSLAIGDFLPPRLQKKANRERRLHGPNFDLEAQHPKLRPPTATTDLEVASRQTPDAPSTMRPRIAP